jgi:hypothetical protein
MKRLPVSPAGGTARLAIYPKLPPSPGSASQRGEGIRPLRSAW